MSTTDTIYKSFFCLLALGVLLSACQTETPVTQQKKTDLLLQTKLDNAIRELDSIKKITQSPTLKAVRKDPPKSKPKPKPKPKPSFRETPPKKEPKPAAVVTYTPPVVNPVRTEPTVVPQPRPTNPTISNEINLLKTAIQQEKRTMLQAKTEAESTDAEALANATYEEALTLERTAEEKAQQLTSTALKEAKENFMTARERFQTATKEATQLMAARSEADKAKDAMLAMRRNIGNGSRNPTTLASYKEAIESEKQGDEQYEASQFQAAAKTYIQAEILYKTAKEIAAKQPRKNNDSQKLNTTKVEDRKIRIKIDNYGQLLEVGDIQGLLQEGYISAKEKSAWSGLFNNVENMTIKINNKAIDIKGNKATVSFSVKMYYQNKSNNKVEESSFSKNWELNQKNDRWLISN